MRKNIIRFSLLLLIIFLSTSTPAHLHAQNPLNEKIPARIISLKPNITELLFALGAGDQIVGVTTWCDKPEAAKLLPKVADYIKPNIEKILVLKPDLIIASKENSVKAPFRILKDSGIEVIYLSFKSIAELFDAVDRLAKATGHEEEGKRLVSNMRDKTNPENSSPSTGSGRTGEGNNTIPTVLMIVGKRPLVAAGTRSFLSELVELAGGKNIVDSKIPYPHINMETVIAKEPDVIIDFSMGSEERHRTQDTGHRTLESRVYSLNISDFRLGPNLAEQIQTLNEILYSKR